MYTYGYRNSTNKISVNATHFPSVFFSLRFYVFFLDYYWISDKVIFVLCIYVEFDSYEPLFPLSIKMLMQFCLSILERYLQKYLQQPPTSVNN